MADLRIVDAPEIPTENITGEEKLPTGGSGNYSISLDSLADYTKTKKDLADNTSVDTKVNGVRQELDAHIEDLLNPHQVTKGQIGLGNVDNTADADKPVSNSTQASIISAVAPKADKTYVDTQLTLKANKTDVYTKAETYTKANVYTKQESNDLVNNSISTALTPVNNSLDLAKRGIANRYDPLLTYNPGERVVLTNGDIVKSTINGNTNNPNADMAGWVKTNSDSQITTLSGLTQRETNQHFENTLSEMENSQGVINESLEHKISSIKPSILNNIYQKSIFAQLPTVFPDYQSVLATGQYRYLYPQAFYMDQHEDYREIIINYDAAEGIDVKRWVTFWDLDTLAYKGCCSIGYQGTESIVVKHQDGRRLLYATSAVSTLGIYDITELPVNLTTLQAIETVSISLRFQFSEHNGEWLFENSVAPVGGEVKRNMFTRYNSLFTPIGSVYLRSSEGGNGVGSGTLYEKSRLKRQGFANCGSFIVASYGGITRKTTLDISDLNVQGVKVFSPSGDMLVGGLMNPHMMMDILEKKGLDVSRVESEGVIQARDGTVYSMWLTKGPEDIGSSESGIIIFKEFSQDVDAIDFSSANSSYTDIDLTTYEVGIFPRTATPSGVVMLNPFTGENLNTVDKILDFMAITEMRHFSWYTNAVTVLNINGEPFPSNELVEIVNANTTSFHMTRKSNFNIGFYIIFGTTGSRTARQLIVNSPAV